MDDKETDDILPMDAEPIVDQPMLETAPSIPEPEATGPERDESGRFKAKDKGEALEAPPASEPDSRMVPIGALEDYRRKWQDLRDEFDAYKQQAAPQEATPDIFEDPEARLAVERQQFQQALYAERYTNSMRFAEIQHGKEAVAEAVNWAAERAKADPQFNMSALSQPDPVGFALDQYRREQMASIPPEDFAAFQAWREMQESQPPKPAPRSFPTSTVQDGSVASRGGPVWSGITPDSKLLPLG